MAKDKKNHDVEQGVVSAVFKSFIEALRNDTSLDPSMADRFNSALLEEGKELSADELRRVLFFEEPIA